MGLRTRYRPAHTTPAPKPCHTGSTTTTTRGRTAHSEANPPSAAFTTSVGRTPRSGPKGRGHRGAPVPSPGGLGRASRPPSAYAARATPLRSDYESPHGLVASRQRARSVAGTGGLHGAGRAAQHRRSRPAVRIARVRALLAGGAPRDADARLHDPRGRDRGGCRRDGAHPCRQRRGDVAALQPAQGRRELQRAQRPLSRADRPRDRPGTRDGSPDDVRAAARPAARGPGRLPGAACRAARLSRGRLPTRPSARAVDGIAGAARGAGGVAARLLAAERDLGRPSSGFPIPSRISSTPEERSTPSSTASGSHPRSVPPSPWSPSPSRRSAQRPTRRRSDLP